MIARLRILSLALTSACIACVAAPLPSRAASTGAGTVVSWLAFTHPPASTSNSVSSLAAGSFHNLALRTDGTVIPWGETPLPLPNGLQLTGIKAIGAGTVHALAVRSNGTVVAWGDNTGGQTNVPALPHPIVAVDGGDFHSLALSTSTGGAVFGWGGFDGAGIVPPGLYSFPVIDMAAGARHSLAVYKAPPLNTGRVTGWGNNTSGQISIPVNAGNGVWDILAVAAGARHSLALVKGGTVIGWGNNSFGQAQPPITLTNAVAIAAGGDDSMARTADGRIVVWGANTSGIHTPPSLQNVRAIAVGQQHRLAAYVTPLVITSPPTNQSVLVGQTATFAVTASGALPLTYQWQYNTTNIVGATSPTLTLNNVQLSQAGLYSVTVRSANELSTNSTATLSVNSPPAITAQPQNITVNSGQPAFFEVDVNGTVPLHYQWRKNGANIPLGINFAYVIQNTRASDAGNYDVVITNHFGSVTSQLATLTVNLPPTITDQPDDLIVLAGSSASFAVTASGATSYLWRKDNVSIPNATNATYNINTVQLTDAGNYSVLVANAFGNVLSRPATLVVEELPEASSTNIVAWGQILFFNGTEYVDTSPLGGLGDITALAAGLGHSIALRENGTVVGWGDNSRTQSSAPGGLNNVTQIAAGDFHSVALTANGSVFAWGDNEHQQSTPPTALSNIGFIAAGARHSLALRTDGTVVGWGASSNGQSTPPPGTSGIRALAAGTDFSLGLKTNGTIVGWGENEHGQTRAPSGLSGVIAIDAGISHSMALKANGTVAVWGRNNHGQTDVPPDLTNVQAIAAGANHCLALLPNGTVVSWGQNNEGQTEPPARLSGLLIAAGGSRSLALVRNLFVIDPPTPLPAGGWRLRIRHSNGAPVLSEEIPTLQMRVTDDPSIPPQSWPTLNSPFILLNGVVLIDDPASFYGQRFYYLIDNR